MSLDSRWLALVRDTTSKNPDKWVTLSELDNYLNEDETERIIRIEEKVFPKSEPDGSSLEERMDALDDTETGAVPVLMARADAVYQQLFETQGMTDKLAAMELRKDEAVEILENKNIVNPQINETPVRAYFDIALSAPATNAIRISAITPGIAANSYTYDVVPTEDPESVGIFWSPPGMDIVVLKDGDGNITTTAYELARLAADTRVFVSNFIISFDDGTLITEDGDGAGVIAKADTGSFDNGAGADHVLTSTGTQIDAAVAVAPEYTATFATAAAATATYTINGTNPAVGSTVMVNDQTYRFMDTMATANDVQIGEDADTTLGNLVAAINLSGTSGTEYYAGTSAATGVTAGAVDSHATVVTADTMGTAANAYKKGVSADPDSHIVLDVTNPADRFSGGVDGQVGATGKIIFTDDVVYFCTDGEKCVIADSSGWKTVTISE